ncbi:hypothetical protein MuYL_4817 [Mucilaginibacter xinganensis]|uniref:Uncharacterized protein n=1 Tax=Mucilaginibacter xinganensis TaxID=1234841 RepID=A0A223P3T6_9SPHI|nr:hypothetical protein MuYL_4817 [Mucilaginibacter xinganensis]
MALLLPPFPIITTFRASNNNDFSPTPMNLKISLHKQSKTPNKIEE